MVECRELFRPCPEKIRRRRKVSTSVRPNGKADASRLFRGITTERIVVFRAKLTQVSWQLPLFYKIKCISVAAVKTEKLEIGLLFCKQPLHLCSDVIIRIYRFLNATASYVQEVSTAILFFQKKQKLCWIVLQTIFEKNEN